LCCTSSQLLRFVQRTERRCHGIDIHSEPSCGRGGAETGQQVVIAPPSDHRVSASGGISFKYNPGVVAKSPRYGQVQTEVLVKAPVVQGVESLDQSLGCFAHACSSQSLQNLSAGLEVGQALEKIYTALPAPSITCVGTNVAGLTTWGS